MPPWSDLELFLAVARHGGLSAAARETGASAPTLGRRMHALERALSAELFVRGTHGYDLTEAGRALRAGLEDVAARVERLTAPREGLPEVKVSAGTWTALALVRRMTEVTGEPPDLALRLLPSEETLSIARREAVIGLRRTRPAEEGLAGRRIARVSFAAYGIPYGPERLVRVHARTPSALWVEERAGPDAPVAPAPRLALDMALAGLGRAVLPTFIGDAEPSLRRAGGPIESLAHDQWLVTHDEDRHLPEVRRAIERIARALGE